tara:strand:+ start:195 stop:593 length:399 start_codon:yes stop_codon:yes gene_type:complete
MPDKIVIHWVIVKEPNKFTKFDGRIYVLLESVGEPESNFLARFFGYRKAKVEPRLHGLDYTRALHEQIEKGIMPQLRSGQPVVGSLRKKGKPSRGSEDQEGSGQDGDGSESQRQRWEFHKLLPSDIHNKPER